MNITAIKALMTAAVTAVSLYIPAPLQAAAVPVQISSQKDDSVQRPTGYVKPEPVVIHHKDQASGSTRKAKRSAQHAPRKTPEQQINWDDYSSKYFYNQLNDDEKDFYDGLTAAAKKIMNSSDNFENYPVSFSNMTSLQAEKLFIIWQRTEAQYFFVYNYMGLDDTDPNLRYIIVNSEYQNGKARQEGKTAFLNTINSLTKDVKASDPDHIKERKIHDALIKRLSYDKSDTASDQSSSSSLIGNKTVCAGYSAAFSILMNKAGIPTVSITSSVHEWNESYIDGHWHNVDVLWDDQNDTSDPDGFNEDYEYFNSDDDYIKEVDTSKKEHTPADFWDDHHRPKCDENGWSPVFLQSDSSKISAASLTYGDTLKGSKIDDPDGVIDEDNNPVAGTWHFRPSEDSTKADSSINGRDYDVWFIPTENPENYSYPVSTAHISDIRSRPVTVNITPASRESGKKNPDLTWSLADGSTLGSGDTDDSIGITLSCTADKTSSTGEYPITGTWTNKDYDVTFNPASLTVTEKESKTPVITIQPSIDMTYGDRLSDDLIKGGAADTDGTFALASDTDTSAILHAGEHTADITFIPASEDYSSVTFPVTFTVKPKKITVKISDTSVTEGDALPSSYDIEIPDDALVNGDASESLKMTFTTDARSDIPGTYKITGASGSSDYDVAVTDGTITINAKPEEKPADTTVQTAPTITVIYGDRLSSASITNGSVVSDGNAVTGIWTITTSDRVVNKSNVSQKVTLAFTPSDTKKYSPVSVDITPTVTKRKVTVKADDIARTVGETRTLTYKITNGSLVSGDTESDLRVSLRSSNSSDTAGTYIISGTADADYYDVTVQNGTLTVNARSSDNPLNPTQPTVTTYSITYDLNGGTATENPSSYRNDSESFTLAAPARTGYTFTGWTGSNGNTPQTTVTIRKGTTGNLYFVANWQDNNSANDGNTSANTTGTYKISYNLNGGSMNKTNPTSYTVNDTYLINNPWREGYFFAGWTSALSSTPQMVAIIPRGTTGDITFTAAWTPDTGSRYSTDTDDDYTTDSNTQTDDGWTELINGNDDSDIPDIPSTSITKTSAGKKSVTIKFRKASVSGYTVRYQVAIKKANTGGWKKSYVSKTSKTFKGLKKKTTYWVSVRPYITVDSTRYYGDWSETNVRRTK